MRDRRILAGTAALAAIAILVCGAFAGLVAEGAGNPAGALAAFDAWLWRVARFTLWQAALSTLLSVLPAILVARALFRQRDLPFHDLLLRLFAVPLALPAIVAALGVLALYGRAGLLADAARWTGLDGWPSIYGLSGILIAHVFFNLPLATRLLLEALETSPPDEHRLASQLGLGERATFRFVEWPVLRRALPGVAGLVFMLCVTSFTIVLTLGGGPAATTLEVAIYQSLRFDFDPARAATLTAVQIALTALVMAGLERAGMHAADINAPLAVTRRRHLSHTAASRAFDAGLVALAAIFVAGPLAATAIAGMSADLGRLATERAFLQASATSLVLATLAAMAALLLSLALVAARRALELRRGAAPRGVLEYLTGTGSSLVLVLPPVVLGAGWFLSLRGRVDVFAAAPVMVVAVNAAMAMPFVVRAIRPAYDAASARHEKLSAMLGIGGWSRWRLVDWPALRRPMAAGLAFAMALSLGDLGVIALFGSEAVQTLPYLLLARMSAYRTEDAAGLALLLGLLCLALVFIADRLGTERR
ncbi:MAG: thiamine/thiamine pyrophosphate ABC transporter permease [Rhizobiaceae bacterium]|nr:thiamine/thiamine pyrophosphate ABC transporter permease [Rhizobiaceae bacterium]MCV0404604.1 thiamine/thiamine pyrophosphate ABC transporter permease [Rhizobiaceae bacterium]